MKKIILKTAIFVIPFVFFFVITELFYSNSESPDLLRLGYFPNVLKDNRIIFHSEFKRKIYLSKISETKKRNAKVLTIGDSFSEQGNVGYQNYLAEKCSVLHVDRFISNNQIQTLYGLLNGDFFEKNNFEYVILENVERNFISNVKKTNKSKLITTTQLDSIINNYRVKKIEEHKNIFFSSKTVNFPLSMFRYYLDNNYLSNKAVYNITLKTNTLFSNNSNKLFFYIQDLENLKQNNDIATVQKVNDVLNELSAKLALKKIKLIVLPAPDKYDLYYDYIVDKTNFPQPLFFEIFSSLKKDYMYIDSKIILSDQLNHKKDIYFYDDTHWSPVASKIIAAEIEKKIHDEP